MATQKTILSNYALDNFAPSVFAASPRRLASAYSGPIMRVRRSSDNVEADIGFLPNGDLDTYGLMSHVGSQNMLLWSEDFSNTSWNKRGNASVSPGLADPFGSNRAFTINIDSGNNDIYQATSGQINDTAYSPSIWVNNLGGSGIFSIRNPQFSTSGDWRIDLSMLPLGWQRITRNSPYITVVSEFIVASNGGGLQLRSISGTLVFGVAFSQQNAGFNALDYCKTTSSATVSGQNLQPYSENGTGFTTSGTTPPVITNSVSFLGKTAVKIDFTSASALGYAGTRAERPAVSFNILNNTTYSYAASISLSRALIGAESINMYATGSNGIGGYIINSTNSGLLVGGYIKVGSAGLVGTSGTDYFVVHNGAAALTSPLSVYITEMQVNEGLTLLPYIATNAAPYDAGSGFVTAMYDQSGFSSQELVTNGNFNTDISSWSLGSAFINGTVLWSTVGALRLTNNGSGSSGAISIPIAVSAGKKYIVSYRKRVGMTTAALYVSTTSGASSDLTASATGGIGQGSSAGSFSEIITATTSTLYISPVMWSSIGTFEDFDDISVKEVRSLTQSTASNQPRIVNVGIIDRIIVAENLLTYSEQFDNAAWITTGFTVTPDAIVAPDGSLSADKILSVSGSNALARQVTATATSHTFTIYTKVGNRDSIQFLLRNNSTATALDSADILYASGNNDSHFKYVGNGWWRVIMSSNSGIAVGDQLGLYFGATGAITPGHYWYVWGAQLNTGSVATTYAKTTYAVVNKGDANALNRPGFRTNGVNQYMTSGAFALSQPFTRSSVLQFLSVGPSSQCFFDSSPGSAENALFMPTTGNLQMYANTGTPIVSGALIGSSNQITEVYNANNSFGYYNGAISGPLAPGVAGMTVGFILGNNQAFAMPANTIFSDIIIFPQLLSTSDRVSLESNQKLYYRTP